MKNELTEQFVSKVLKLDKHHTAIYNIQYMNIEVFNNETKEARYINIQEFIHTHARDFLMSYSNGLVINSYSKNSKIDRRIIELHFDIRLTVPNLLSGGDTEHIETFSGLSELYLYVSAVEWLIKYREDNPKLSKFWINRF